MNSDSAFMSLALEQGHAAQQAGEVPVGAVIIKDGQVIALGRNASLEQHDPSAHAEMVAIRAAATALGNYRLDGCELFVTLEPCAMCAGAILHARLKRVVFGAFDPKTGAAGSVVNLFDFPALNHQTRVQGGVLQEPCAHILQEFFRTRRDERRASEVTLREDALRTPDTRFNDIADYPWSARYISHLGELNGLRLHYLDMGNPAANHVILCIHGNGTWSYTFRNMIPTWCDAGCRVIAPDLIGFGKSDKPKRVTLHTLEFHRNYLLELMESFDLRNVVLLGCGVGASIANMLFDAAPTRVLSVFHAPASPRLDRKTWTTPNQAPFPDAGHCAALEAFSTFEDSALTNAAYCDADLNESFAKNILQRLSP